MAGMRQSETSARSGGRVRRSAALLACLGALAVVGMMMGGAATASASNETFCTFVEVGPNQACFDGKFRLITRVNAKSINNSVCAGAFNSSGVEIGGWTCTAEAGETSNGNYNGKLNLNGAVLNNFGTKQVLGGGQEWYNP
jgi:hypothetical protein